MDYAIAVFSVLTNSLFVIWIVFLTRENLRLKRDISERARWQQRQIDRLRERL